MPSLEIEPQKRENIEQLVMLLRDEYCDLMREALTEFLQTGKRQEFGSVVMNNMFKRIATIIAGNERN